MTLDPDATKVLIVDDRADKLLVYRTVLEELGQSLVTVSSGAEALREVLRDDFAVILLDVNMPDMDGFETARFIRQRRRSAHTPIIFLTAFTDEMREAKGYAHGAVDYILTPVVPEVLRAKVRVFVELFRMRRQVARQAEEQARREAAEELARRSNFLAGASAALTRSLDPDLAVRGLLGVVVPELADLAAVTRAPGPDLPFRTDLAWAGPGGQLTSLSCPHADGDRDALRAGIDRVLATGASESLTDLALPGPPAPDAPPAPVQSALILPLHARGRTLGALTLARCRPDRPFSPTELALAEDLASRAAIALDNAGLYRDIQEADRRKNEFLAMLAHELRNPLAPVRNAVEILRLCDTGRRELNWARDVIGRQVAHLARLVDDLLDVARITRDKLQLQTDLVDVADVVAAAVETSRPLIEERRHHLTVELDPGPLRARADPARLAQVLTNLLNNAAKYTPEAGRVALRVTREAGDAVFRVRDNGAGLPRDMLARVFEPFTQIDRSPVHSQGGLGVGLTLVRRLVELHGGSVRADSEGPGLGSEFTVRLPLAAEDAPDVTAAPARPAPAPAPCRVLVVDDNTDAADGLAELLRMTGHDVRIAYDGLEALEVAGTLLPQVVLLDLGLPGLDGYGVARELRRRPGGGELTLIAVSGYGQDEDRHRTHLAGFDHHLVKPVEFDALREVLPRR